MKILGIETSCDETAAAVVVDGTKVLSNVIASQVAIHNKTGGVVPEVAAREHVLKIIPVIEQALKEADVTLEELDAIAVTKGPGLMSSLVIGVAAASTLAMASSVLPVGKTAHLVGTPLRSARRGKIFIPVNHIAGHIYANWLDEETEDPVQFPLVVLTVSGGHNELVLMREHVDFVQLGETLDDAAGEAFDKVARLLGLGYPGGPQISKAGLNGDPNRFAFPKAYISKDSYDFSFSGLKTAVLNVVEGEHARQGKLSEQFKTDCAASFEEAICQILSDKLLRACDQYQVKEVHLAGGVSANKHLRAMVEQKITDGYFFDHKGKKTALHVKPRLRYAQNIKYCTDNAAMIASTAFFHYQKNPQKYKKFTPVLADPNLHLYNKTHE